MASKLYILAIEPDQACGRRLQQMVAHRTGADVVVVPTVDAAILTLSSRRPDAILTSTLLPPQEEAHLQAHLRARDERADLPVLIVPPVSGSPFRVEPRRGLFSLQRRTRLSPAPYDASAIVERIEDAIAEARRHEAARQARFADEAIDEIGTPEPISILKADPGANVRRFRAPRCEPGELGWLSGAKTSYGLPVRIINISGSGMLLEAPNKIVSGSTTDIQLYGPDRTIVIPSRVVRAEVAGVNNRGVKYLMAAAFERKLDLIRVVAEREGPPASPRALADLLARLSADIESGHDVSAIRSAFELGVQQMVPVREIKLRESPVRPIEDGESVYFSVPTGTGASTILQVTFEPDYEPAASELRLLKAAAAAAAIVMMYEHRAPRASRVDYLATAARGSGIGGG